MKNECKRCGCNFPNTEIYEIGCINCETPEEMFERSMALFKYNPKDKDKDHLNYQLQLQKLIKGDLT